jgi:peptidoglycan/LPS O-acetylase OafA/YrhL
VFQSFGISYANSAALAFVVYVAAVILVSAVFYRLVDAPSMRRADRVGARLWRAAPAKVEERQAISG